MTIRTPRRSLVAALLLATLVACGQNHSENAAETQAPPAKAQAAADANMAASAAADTAAPPAGAPAEAKNAAASPTTAVPVSAQLTSAANTVPDGQRQFIRTAHAEFRVRDVYRSALAIEDIVAANGGFVVSNDITTQTGNTQRRARGDGKLVELAEFTTRGALVVRVPSAKTQAFLLAIAGQVDFLDRPGTGWSLEHVAFTIPLPDASGNCAPGLAPIYRLYNNRWRVNDSNHRYAASVTERERTVSQYAAHAE